MSKIIASAAIRGAHEIAKQAEDILAIAIKEKGEDCPVAFPNTGYYIPIIYSMTAMVVEKLSDFKAVMAMVKDLLPEPVDDELWLPHVRNSGQQSYNNLRAVASYAAKCYSKTLANYNRNIRWSTSENAFLC